MRAVKLKEELAKRGLATAGLKRHLIERLAQYEVWKGGNKIELGVYLTCLFYLGRKKSRKRETKTKKN